MIQDSFQGGYVGAIDYERCGMGIFRTFHALDPWSCGRPAGDHRLVLDGVFWIARTGAQWRDLPEEFGKWSSVYRQFRRWTLAGLWEMVLEALNESGAAPNQVQMIDSTVIRAHHPLPGRALR